MRYLHVNLPILRQELKWTTFFHNQADRKEGILCDMGFLARDTMLSSEIFMLTRIAF